MNTINRESLISSQIAKTLFQKHENLLLICDGTYCYHQKSNNNAYQRKSYSGQKKTSLCKPFTICTTDGYIIDMKGPYLANQNDAEILKNILQEPNSLSSVLKKNDIFILDRGFRDVRHFLEERGFVVLMPSFKGKEKQLSTSDANNSRFVTKLRWVIEAVHGIIKQKYHLIQRKLDNKMLYDIGSYFRIASFLHNKFGERLNSDTKYPEKIGENMIAAKHKENELADIVEKHGWLRKKLPFKNITSDDVCNFPEMNEDDLKLFFMGSYQFMQAISYLAEMIKSDNTLKIKINQKDPFLLKIEIQFRHISSKKYRCFIQYDPQTIKNHYCECANGKRTVGCCSHIAAVIYYLSYARFLSLIPKPAEKLLNIFKKRDIQPIIEEDSDND